MGETLTGIDRLSLVCVPTPADRQQDVVAFYERLGFGKRTDVDMGDGYRWVEVYLPDSATGIALAPPPPGQPVSPTVTGITLTTGDIDATHAAFRQLGVDADEVSRMGGPVPPLFFFRDPTGHTLMVVEQT